MSAPTDHDVLPYVLLSGVVCFCFEI
jgi:hypothetical protein